jgi:aspartate aminotransferase/aminotransferase
MRRSGIREVLDLAVHRPGVLRLEIGEPDFPTPAHIVEAAARALAEGYTKYTVNRGIPSLREAIRAKLAARNGIDAEVEQIVVTTGGGTALIETLLALVEPGQAILISDPAWPNYEMMAATLQRSAIRSSGRPSSSPTSMRWMRSHAIRARRCSLSTVRQIRREPSGGGRRSNGC